MQISNFMYLSNNISQGKTRYQSKNECQSKPCEYGSMPILSPLYYSPSFKSEVVVHKYSEVTLLDDTEVENLKDAVEKHNTDEIFKSMGIDYKKDEDGLYILSHFRPLVVENPKVDCDEDERYIPISEIGVNIDTNELMENVSEIEGDADFSGTNIKTFSTLKTIGGIAHFDYTPDLESFGSLEKVKGSLYVSHSGLKDTGNLSEIAELLEMHELPNLKSLTNLVKSGTITLQNTPNVEKMEALQEAKAILIIGKTKLKSIPNLKKAQYIQIQNPNKVDVGTPSYNGVKAKIEYHD